MASGSPRRPALSEGFALGDLSPSDFESLCHQLILLEFPSAVRVRPSDRGADSILVGEKSSSYVRAWQAKRHTSGIKWSDCEQSLDSAIEHYGMPHYTFCFVADLTGNQEETFQRRLRARGEAGDVAVDYWGRAKIEQLMTSTESGRRVAERFFQNQPAAKLVERAMRSGGPLSTFTDLADRATALGEFAAGNDSVYEYPTEIRETHGPPSRSPYAPISTMSVTVESEEVSVITHAVKRPGSDAPDPVGTFSMESAPKEDREKLERVLNGGKATFEGVQLDFEHLPKLFSELVEATEDGVLKLHVKPQPAPWDATIRVSTDRGEAALDIDLVPEEPTDSEWDACLRGHTGNVSFEVLFMWDHDEGRGTFASNWKYSHRPQPATRCIRDLRFINALHGSGIVTISDRSGNRDPLQQKLQGTELSKWAPALLQLAEAVQSIERYAGVEIEIPQEIDKPAAESIAFVAKSIQDGGFYSTFERAQMTLPLNMLEEFTSNEKHRKTMRTELKANVFDRQLDFGSVLLELPPTSVKVVSSKKDPDCVVVEIFPTDESNNQSWTVLPDSLKELPDGAIAQR